MGAMAFQITSLTIVYSTIYSGTDQRKHQSSALLAFERGNSPVTGEFPAQRASNAENVSIWWRHHVFGNHRWDGRRDADQRMSPSNFGGGNKKLVTTAGWQRFQQSVTDRIAENYS